MDLAQVGVEMSREEELISTKKRLESFQFRRTGGTVTSAPLSPASAFGRPHSRNGSVSSVSRPGSISINSVGTAFDQPSLPPSDSRPSSFVGRPRPTSHHRRRSSVSTRTESAEMMGITLPELPLSSSDDNINFGDKDSVRRRALQALEGRNDLGSCNTTVEIPDFTSPGIPQKPFDREFKLPASGLSFGLSSLPGKRDSFGKFLSSANSLKDQLHTLMEEEEEEEEDSVKEKSEGTVQPANDSEPEVSLGGEKRIADSGNDRRDTSEFPTTKAEGTDCTPTSGVTRNRPANLTLRPLSLISSASSPNFPTPSVTPSSRPGLRSFSLVTQTDPLLSSSSEGCDTRWSNQVRKQSADVPHSNSSSFSSTTSGHQSTPGCGQVTGSNPKRQSSISYIRSGSGQHQQTTFTLASLPTPGATPTSERRQSASSVSSFGSICNQDRRNMSEDMFLHQSHASLLARIAELEHALHAGSRSRPVSVHSDDSTDNEMLRLVTDLKAERDELNKDIEGWRQRVKDLERAKASLGHEKVSLELRLEAERREAWLKGEKISLLELEKGTLDRQLMMKEEDVSNISRKLEDTQAQLGQARFECDSLREDAEVSRRQLAETYRLLEARKEVEAELRRAHETLAAEQQYREKVISQLDAAGILETPRVSDKITRDSSRKCVSHNDQPRSGGLGFQSIDSSCTTVDADESQQVLSAPFTLKAVEEESEAHSESSSDEENELARYEEEDDLIIDFTSPRSMSSSGSEEDFPRSLSHLRLAGNGTPVPVNCGMTTPKSSPSTPSPTSSPCPTPIPPLLPDVRNSSHAPYASLSKNWTFPRGAQSPSIRPPPQEVDRFFGCLDDMDNSPPVGSCLSVDDRSIFSQRLHLGDAGDEDLPPFVLPVQKVSGEAGNGKLDVIVEEDQDELHCDSPSSRRKVSLPLSVNEKSLNRMSSPLFDDQPRTNSVPFVFPQSTTRQDTCRNPTASLTLVSEANGSKSTGSPEGSVSDSPVSTKPTNMRHLPPSRIPPPSPPRFFQAKVPLLRGTPSPPRHKNGPTTTLNAGAASPSRSPSRLKPLGVPVNSPRGVKKTMPVSTHGSTFIPQLKVTIDVNISSLSPSPEDQKQTVSNVSRLFTPTVKRDVDRLPERNGSNRTYVSSSQPLLQAFTTFLPLPSLPWVKNRSETIRKPTYVPKEKQLAKLRASTTLNCGSTLQPGGFTPCKGCRGDLISL